MKYDHIFFDLDHTLWDFDTNSRQALCEIFEVIEWGGSIRPDANEFVTVYQRINEECWDQYRKGLLDKDNLRVVRFRKSLNHFDLDDHALADRLGNMYIQISPRKTNLMNGTMEILDYLKAKSYALHIITNGFSEVQFVKLDNCGLSPYFTQIVTSEEVGQKKPHPDVFEYALQKADAPRNRSLMIGDDIHVDVKGALDIGMDQVYYNPLQKETGPATYEISDLLELREIL
jgi:putative hydrolase of the HAD superfamily